MNNSSLQTEYLNIDSSNSGSSKHNQKENSSKTKCTYCGLSNHSVEKCFKNIRKEKEKARSAGTSSKINSDRPAQKCFRCGSEDHLIAKCTKPPKDIEKRRKSGKSKEKVNSAKDNSDDYDDLKVYASMARMSNDDVYFKVIIIITVVFCTIDFFLRFIRLAFFLAVFRRFGTFCDYMIFRSASKTFPSWTI